MFWLRRLRKWLAHTAIAASAAVTVLLLRPAAAAAQQPEGWVEGCPLPLEMSDLCSDPKRLLPMWRWTWANYHWSDWSGWWDFARIRAAIGGMYDFVVRVLFVLASLVWYLLSRLLYMVLSADFSGAIADDINSVYKLLAESLITSGVWFIVAIAAFLAGAWALYRYDTRTAWRRILTSWIMLGLMLTMLWPLQELDPKKIDPDISYIGQNAPDDARIAAVREHGARQNGTPLWVYSAILDISDDVSYSLAGLSLGLTDRDRDSHSSYCSVYIQQLERLYLATVAWRTGEAPSAKHFTPIFLSRLWERAYLGPWSRAQFGGPQSANNGACLWAEANTGHVSAPEVMAVWASSCKYRSGIINWVTTPQVVKDWGTDVPLYGCEGTFGLPEDATPIPPAYPNKGYSPANADRAWRIFRPDGDDETLAFLNIISGCGLTPAGDPTRHGTYTSGVHPNAFGVPEVPGVWDPTVNDLDGDESLTARRDYGYIEASRIGMRPDGGEEQGEWFSLDVCTAWLTGTQVTSGVDKRHNQKTGYDNVIDNQYVEVTCDGVQVIVSVGRTVWNWLSGGGGSQEDLCSRLRIGQEVHQGLNSGFVRHRAHIGCNDAEVSASKVAENMADFQDLGRSTSAAGAYAAAADICTFAGGRMFDRILNGFIVLGVAFSFAFSLLGMTVGTALAQILLVIVIMTLPFVLVVSALPMQATRGLLLQTVKLAFFAAIAHAMFLLILASMVFLIDILIAGVAQGTDPGSYLRLLLLAIIPFVVKKILAGIGKRMNLDFTSMKGGLRVTSGLASAGFGNDQNRLGTRLGYYGHSLAHGAMYGRYGRGPRGMAYGPRPATSFGHGRGRGGTFTPGPSRGGRAGTGSRPAGTGGDMFGGTGSGPGAAALAAAAGAGSVLSAGRGEPSGSRAGRAMPTGRPDRSAEVLFPAGGPPTGGWTTNNDGLLVPPSARSAPPATDVGTAPAPTEAPAGARDTDADDAGDLDPSVDYDPHSQTRRSPRTRIRGAAGGAAKYAFKHPLATFATLGVLSGVGIPAAAAVYLSGKAIKFAIPGPRRLIRRMASQVADSGPLDRARDAMRSSQTTQRLRERGAQSDPPMVSRLPQYGPPAPTPASEPGIDAGPGAAPEPGAAPTAEQRTAPHRVSRQAPPASPGPPSAVPQPRPGGGGTPAADPVTGISADAGEGSTGVPPAAQRITPTSAPTHTTPDAAPGAAPADDATDDAASEGPTGVPPAAQRTTPTAPTEETEFIIDDATDEGPTDAQPVDHRTAPDPTPSQVPGPPPPPPPPPASWQTTDSDPSADGNGEIPRARPVDHRTTPNPPPPPDQQPAPPPPPPDLPPSLEPPPPPDQQPAPPPPPPDLPPSLEPPPPPPPRRRQRPQRPPSFDEE